MSRPRRRVSLGWTPMVGVLVGVLAVLGAYAADSAVAAAPGSSGPAEAAAAFGAGRASDVAGVPAADERVTRFAVTMTLRRDGSVRVVETEMHRFPSGETRHGILRDIRVRAGYRDRTDVYRYYPLSDLTVTSPTGAPTDVQRSEYGPYVHLRIGNPDVTVSGTQTYVISYTLAHVVNEIDATSAEFVHDVVGTANEQVYDRVTASVRAPEASTKAACWRGPAGSTQICDATPGDRATFSVSALEPGEGMTVAVSVPRSAFSDLSPDLREGDPNGSTGGSGVLSPSVGHLVDQLTAGLGLFLPLLAIAGMGALVWSRGRDEYYAGLTPGLRPVAGEEASVVRGSAPTVAVQFNPPPGVQPGMVGTIIDEQANTVDVSASVVDLAVRGYLTMEEVPARFGRSDWRLTRRTGPASGSPLATYEAELLDALFSRGSPVLLSDLKNHFASSLELVKQEMYSETVRRGWFRSSPHLQRSAWKGIGTVLVLLGLASIFFLGPVLGTGVTSGVLPFLPFSGTAILGGGLLLAGIIVRLLGARMASRTADGSAVLAQSEGFREYLETAEANQIRFEEAQDIFSRYLPYAIVFGVAEKWARTFDQVAAAAASAGVPLAMPTWYVGPSLHYGAFASIASGSDAFATQAAGTFVSTPGSSGSSVFGSGGFGGGGFSGGGGTGSSGGSW